jgi:hypothetical protein
MFVYGDSGYKSWYKYLYLWRAEYAFDMNILAKIIKMHIGNQSFIKLNTIWLDGLIIRYSSPPLHTHEN